MTVSLPSVIFAALAAGLVVFLVMRYRTQVAQAMKDAHPLAIPGLPNASGSPLVNIALQKGEKFAHEAIDRGIEAFVAKNFPALLPAAPEVEKLGDDLLDRLEKRLEARFGQRPAAPAAK